MQVENRIFVIIVNFNNASDTIKCLQSLTKFTNLTPVLVDNNSSDDSLTSIKKKFPSLKTISSPQNLGFAGGNNLGIKYALKQKADYIMLLNNDTIVDDKKFFASLIEINVDIAAPIIKFKREGKTVYDHGGKVDYLFGRNTHTERGYPLNRPPQTDYFSGTCLLIKSSVFKKIGLLDDQYFMYYEDVDFCLRANRANMQLKISTQSILTHALSSTSNRNSKLKLRYLASSHRRFVMKYLSPLALPLAFIYNFYLALKSF